METEASPHHRMPTKNRKSPQAGRGSGRQGYDSRLMRRLALSAPTGFSRISLSISLKSICDVTALPGQSGIDRY